MITTPPTTSKENFIKNNDEAQVKTLKTHAHWVPIPDHAPARPDRHKGYGVPSMTWCYHNADGQPLFWVYRFETQDGKAFLPLSYGLEGWAFKGIDAPRPLYNLHLLAQYSEATVMIVEGEKAVDAARQLFSFPEYVVTTSPNGAQSASKADWSPLTGRKILIWPDNDDAGRRYAQTIAELIQSDNVSMLDIANICVDKKSGWDAADAVKEGWGEKQATALLGSAIRYQPKPKPEIRSDYRVTCGKTEMKDGVYYLGTSQDGEDIPPFWVCSPLTITARTRDGQGHNWGYLLEWQDPDGQAHTWAMPSEMLAGQGDEYRRVLHDGGLDIAPGTKAKNHLTIYIQSTNTTERALCTDRIGWHGDTFVLPDGALGGTEQRILYQSNQTTQHAFKQKGTLESWQRHVAMPSEGNSRAVFALSCGFAPVLLALAGEDSGGFHFRGDSSSGKTTLLKLAASVWGGPDYLQRWRATTNGLEGLAQMHNDGLLILDELAQVDPKEAGEIAYMLGNGSGKVRASRMGLAKKSARWRLLYLSAGEIGLSEHVRSIGREVKTGQEIRLADIPADAGQGMGVFETIGDTQDSPTFARMLCESTTHHHGVSGKMFLNHVVDHKEEMEDWIRQQRKIFVAKVVPIGASGQVTRVAERFAIVAIAGALATNIGITGWQVGVAEKAAELCFKAWLDGRGDTGNAETHKLLADIRAQLEAHGESRFSPLDKECDRIVHNRMGFIRDDNGQRQYIIFPEAFKRDLCKAHDAKRASKVLLEFGILLPDTDGKPQRRETLPESRRMRCYVIQANKLWEHE